MNETQSNEVSKDFLTSCRDGAAAALRWCKANPVSVVLLATICGTFVYFFGMVPLFVNHSESAARWAWLAWNPEQDQEHSKLVPWIFAALVWMHWSELLEAPKGSSRWGLAVAGIGILLFLASTRCLEPHMALFSIPFLIFGSLLYLYGKAVARIMLFPCAFLIFLIPLGPIQQATFKLQFIITGIVSVIANLFGMHIEALGTTLSASNSSFHFEVAEGCSGIHSIIAITMLTSVFMHLKERVLWKKVVIVASSVVFAIIGNIGRIFTILLVARLFGADIAGGPYHEYSGYIIYPFAVMAMIGLSALLNMKRKPKQDAEESSSSSAKSPLSRPAKATYDYDY